MTYDGSELRAAIVKLYQDKHGINDPELAQTVLSLIIEAAAKVADDYDGPALHEDNICGDAQATAIDIAGYIRTLSW